MCMNFQNKEKFDQCIRPHLKAAYGFAKRIAGNKVDADDVYQEAILNALRHIDDLKSDSGKPWLLAIVRNAYLSLIRKRGKMSSSENTELLDIPEPHIWTNPEIALMRASDQKIVRLAIEKLPAEFREALILKEFNELSYKEIAQILDVPIGTVMSRIARAREQLAIIILSSAKSQGES